MRTWRRLGRREDGAAAIELALLMPTILFLLFLIMDMGLFFFDYVSAANAVREGARCGAVGHADADVIDRVTSTAGFADAAVTVDRTGGQIGDDIIVSGAFTHDWILPVAVFTVPDQFTRSATMRLETSALAPGGCGTS